jgi:hypothetical protein
MIYVYICKIFIDIDTYLYNMDIYKTWVNILQICKMLYIHLPSLHMVYTYFTQKYIPTL